MQNLCNKKTCDDSFFSVAIHHVQSHHSATSFDPLTKVLTIKVVGRAPHDVVPFIDLSQISLARLGTLAPVATTDERPAHAILLAESRQNP